MPFCPQRLRSTREAVGQSREALAVTIGRSCRTISLYKSGGVTPSLEIAEALAAALDVDLVDLLDPPSEAVQR